MQFDFMQSYVHGSIFTTHVETSGGKWLWNFSVGATVFPAGCSKNDDFTSPDSESGSWP